MNMKKLLSTAAAAAILLVLPVSAASPDVSKWHAIQNEGAPHRTIATANKGRITVTSDFKADKEPGGCAVSCTEPIDLSNFEITFSLDKYTKCRDQYLALSFSSVPLEDAVHADTEHPGFMLMLRPTDEPNTIACGEGLLTNWDENRKKVRVGKSSFAPGAFFEGEVTASWTNIKFATKRNAANTGYDVFINDKRISNPYDQSNPDFKGKDTWSFADDIQKATGGKWYFQMFFKDGDYKPATFTIKTMNGEAAVNQSASGELAGSWKNGSQTTQGSNGPQTTRGDNKPQTTQGVNSPQTTQGNNKPQTTQGADQSQPSQDDSNPIPDSAEEEPGWDSSDSTSADGTLSSREESTGKTEASAEEVQNGGRDGGLGGGAIALIVIGAVVVLGGAGVALYFLVIKKKLA